MTKCIVIGEQPTIESKPIEFIKHFYAYELEFVDTDNSPNNHLNTELICRRYEGGDYDLMFAYDENRNKGVLYLGHWNGGAV